MKHVKYLINRETKEHRIHADNAPMPPGPWSAVVGDPDGWIAHHGKECPLPSGNPGDPLCDVKFSTGVIRTRTLPEIWGWGDARLTHYRPILNTVEPAPAEPDYCGGLVLFPERTGEYQVYTHYDDALKAAEKHTRDTGEVTHVYACAAVVRVKTSTVIERVNGL